MKITIIHGQSHKESTYHVARMLAEKLDGDITEFFLPRDFNQFCIGCTNCFTYGEDKCPHFKQLQPITKAMEEANVIILASPVYVFHVTGAMKAFLDHYGYQWMVHRPNRAMFTKQTVCISTAAGGGTGSTNKEMAHSLFFWGAGKIYKYGVGVQATSYKQVSDKIKSKIDKKTTSLANKIKAKQNKVIPGIKTRIVFFAMHIVQRKGFNQTDRDYWIENGWTKKIRPWK